MSNLKRELTRAMSAYIRETGFKVIPPKRWPEPFCLLGEIESRDCVRRVVLADGGLPLMVLMCWEASINDVSIHIVTPDGQVHTPPA